MTIFNTPLLKPLNYLLGRVFIFLVGWKIEGKAPKNIKKYVLVCAPHTSNWDLVFLLAFAFCFSLDIRWLGKKSLFKFPFGGAMRWLGGVSVDRSRATGVVGQMVEEMEHFESLVLAVPPEGTRGKVREWKTGFYRIADGAHVPIVLGFVDYARKRVGMGRIFHPTGDIDKDLPEIQSFYQDIRGKNDQTSLTVD